MINKNLKREKRNIYSREYYRKHRKKILKRHATKYKEVRKTWRQANPNKVKIARRKAYLRRKLKALQIVSSLNVPKCVYCGCNDMRVLTFNHKYGNGHKDITTKLSVGGIINGKRDITKLEVTCNICNLLHFNKLKYPELKWKIIWLNSMEAYN